MLIPGKLRRVYNEDLGRGLFPHPSLGSTPPHSEFLGGLGEGQNIEAMKKEAMKHRKLIEEEEKKRQEAAKKEQEYGQAQQEQMIHKRWIHKVRKNPSIANPNVKVKKVKTKKTEKKKAQNKQSESLLQEVGQAFNGAKSSWLATPNQQSQTKKSKTTTGTETVLQLVGEQFNGAKSSWLATPKQSKNQKFKLAPSVVKPSLSTLAPSAAVIDTDTTVTTPEMVELGEFKGNGPVSKELKHEVKQAQKELVEEGEKEEAEEAQKSALGTFEYALLHNMPGWDKIMGPSEINWKNARHKDAYLAGRLVALGETIGLGEVAGAAVGAAAGSEAAVNAAEGAARLGSRIASKLEEAGKAGKTALKVAKVMGRAGKVALTSKAGQAAIIAGSSGVEAYKDVKEHKPLVDTALDVAGIAGAQVAFAKGVEEGFKGTTGFRKLVEKHMNDWEIETEGVKTPRVEKESGIKGVKEVTAKDVMRGIARNKRTGETISFRRALEAKVSLDRRGNPVTVLSAKGTGNEMNIEVSAFKTTPREHVSDDEMMKFRLKKTLRERLSELFKGKNKEKVYGIIAQHRTIGVPNEGELGSTVEKEGKTIIMRRIEGVKPEKIKAYLEHEHSPDHIVLTKTYQRGSKGAYTILTRGPEGGEVRVGVMARIPTKEGDVIINQELFRGDDLPIHRTGGLRIPKILKERIEAREEAKEIELLKKEEEEGKLPKFGERLGSKTETETENENVEEKLLQKVKEHEQAKVKSKPESKESKPAQAILKEKEHEEIPPEVKQILEQEAKEMAEKEIGNGGRMFSIGGGMAARGFVPGDNGWVRPWAPTKEQMKKLEEEAKKRMEEIREGELRNSSKLHENIEKNMKEHEQANGIYVGKSWSGNGNVYVSEQTIQNWRKVVERIAKQHEHESTSTASTSSSSSASTTTSASSTTSPSISESTLWKERQKELENEAKLLKKAQKLTHELHEEKEEGAVGVSVSQSQTQSQAQQQTTATVEAEPQQATTTTTSQSGGTANLQQIESGSLSLPLPTYSNEPESPYVMSAMSSGGWADLLPLESGGQQFVSSGQFGYWAGYVPFLGGMLIVNVPKRATRAGASTQVNEKLLQELIAELKAKKLPLSSIVVKSGNTAKVIHLKTPESAMNVNVTVPSKPPQAQPQSKAQASEQGQEQQQGNPWNLAENIMQSTVQELQSLMGGRRGRRSKRKRIERGRRGRGR